MYYDHMFSDIPLPRDSDNDEAGWGNCAVSNTGGWWYNACTHSHLTGQLTDIRTRVSGVKQIFYYEGGDRGQSYDSWLEAEIVLVPNAK